MKVLVVDDEEIKRVSLADEMSAANHQVTQAADAEEAMGILGAGQFDVVVTDLRMPGTSGMDLLRWIQSRGDPRPVVVLMTAYGSIPLAVEAMKVGAFDFLTKPFRNEAILPLLARIESMSTAAPAQEQEATNLAQLNGKIVGDSKVMRQVRKMVALSARTDATVLLTGETGTGKDLMAEMIHTLSSRRQAPFVKVNCAMFGKSLIESELYGHEKGAFTGADERKMGRIDMAQSGTLYLDDVDDIPLDHQIKLLRVIEEKVVERVGAASPIHVNVRIIAATKKQLLAAVASCGLAGDFRNRDIANHLYPSSPTKEVSGKVSYLLRILREHRIIRRLPNTRRYRLTAKGAQIIATILLSQSVTTQQLNKAAA